MELDSENNLFIDNVTDTPRNTEKTSAGSNIGKLPDFDYKAIQSYIRTSCIDASQLETAFIAAENEIVDAQPAAY